MPKPCSEKDESKSKYIYFETEHTDTISACVRVTHVLDRLSNLGTVGIFLLSLVRFLVNNRKKKIIATN